MTADIHQNQPTIKTGRPLSPSSPAVIVLHGRGSSAQAMIPFVENLGQEHASYLIPQASSNRWYPQSAFSPLESNQPDLNSALKTVENLIQQLLEQGLTPEHIVLGGFSQGACLAAEFAAQNARKYGGIFVLSGALIGPQDTPRDYPGSLEETPVFIGSSDIDPWVDHRLVEKTARVFTELEGDVDFRTYPGMGHTINQDELHAVRELITQIQSAG